MRSLYICYNCNAIISDQFNHFRLIARKCALLFVGSLDTPFAKMKYSKNLKELHGKIIECKFYNNEWTFMRERTDKSYPNAFTTAKCEHFITNFC